MADHDCAVDANLPQRVCDQLCLSGGSPDPRAWTIAIAKPRTIERDHTVMLGRTHHALARFAWTGSLIVAALVGSGLINAWFLVGLGGLPRLMDSTYGEVLVVKLALFASMLLMAASNRFRLTPALEQSANGAGTGAALRNLRFSVAIEAGLGITVLAIVAWLGTLEPPVAGG